MKDQIGEQILFSVLRCFTDLSEPTNMRIWVSCTLTEYPVRILNVTRLVCYFSNFYTTQTITLSYSSYLQ